MLPKPQQKAVRAWRREAGQQVSGQKVQGERKEKERVGFYKERVLRLFSHKGGDREGCFEKTAESQEELELRLRGLGQD